MGIMGPIDPSAAGQNLAALILEAGRQRADSTARNFALAAHGISDLGQIPLQVQQQKQMAAKLALEQEQAKRQGALADIQISNLQNQKTDRDALDQAATQLKPDLSNADDVMQSLPGHQREAFQSWVEGMRSKKSALSQVRDDYFGHLAYAIKASDYAPGVIKHAIDSAKSDGYATDSIEQAFQQDPTQVPKIVDFMLNKSKSAQEEWAKHTAPIKGAPGDVFLDPNTHQPMFSVPPKVDLQTKETSAGIQTFDPTTGHLGPVIAQSKPPAAVIVNNNAPKLTDAALDASARRYALDGTLPPLGRGGQGQEQRTKIMNRASELFPSLDIVGNKAGLKADTGSLVKLQTQTDAANAFASVARDNSELLKGAMKDIPDLGAKFLNAPVRSLAMQLGSRDMAKFEPILASVRNEYQRIITNPNLTGVLSDKARGEGDKIMSDSATVGQILSALDVLEKEAGNRTRDYQKQLDTINARIGHRGQSSSISNTTDTGKDPLGIR